MTITAMITTIMDPGMGMGMGMATATAAAITTITWPPTPWAAPSPSAWR